MSVEEKLTSYPDVLEQCLREVRTRIKEIASNSKTIGTIEESLKWGQISFATVRPKSGTPLRIDGDAESGTYSIFVPCSTSLIEDFRSVHPGMFDYHGNREIRLDLNKPIPKQQLALFLSAALRYYL